MIASSHKTTEYVPLCDRDAAPEEQTVFSLGTLTARQKGALMDELVREGDEGAELGGFGTACYLACRYSVRAVRNFDVELRHVRAGKQKLVAEEFMDAIGDVQFELGQEVMRLNGLTGSMDAAGRPEGGEQGNSSSSPTSPADAAAGSAG